MFKWTTQGTFPSRLALAQVFMLKTLDVTLLVLRCALIKPHILVRTIILEKTD